MKNTQSKLTKQVRTESDSDWALMDLVNLQRKVKLDLPPIRAFVASLPGQVGDTESATFSVAFISDDRMRKLNHTFRGKDSTTDVLSFPHKAEDFEQPTGFLGDIVISAEQAQKQAIENGLDLDTEIKQLILHGMLHLCGYDHETDGGEMNALELTLREQLGI